jgi:hypothetical protein
MTRRRCCYMHSAGVASGLPAARATGLPVSSTVAAGACNGSTRSPLSIRDRAAPCGLRTHTSDPHCRPSVSSLMVAPTSLHAPRPPSPAPAKRAALFQHLALAQAPHRHCPLAAHPDKVSPDDTRGTTESNMVQRPFLQLMTSSRALSHLAPALSARRSRARLTRSRASRPCQ